MFDMQSGGNRSGHAHGRQEGGAAGSYISIAFAFVVDANTYMAFAFVDPNKYVCYKK